MICPRTLSRLFDRRFARAWIGLLGGLFIATMLTCALVEIVSDYRRTLAQTDRRLESQAHSLAEQTARSVQAVDMVLRHIGEHFKAEGLSDRVSREVHEYLREHASGLVQTDGLAVHHVNGTQIGVSWQFPPPAVNFARRPFFTALRDGPGVGLFIDLTHRSPTDGHWIFELSRRLEDKAGNLVGIVNARGRVEYFQQFYQAIRLDPGTSIALMRGDGVLLARYPASEAALGKDFPLPSALRTALASGGAPVLRSKGPIDDVERFWALRPVPGYPLAIAVNQDIDAALAAWQERAIGNGVGAGALSLAAALLLAFLMRLLKRLYATRDSLEASEAQYERAMTASNAGHWDLNLITDEEYFSPRVKELYGLPKDQVLMTATQFREQIPVHPDDRLRPRISRATEAGRSTLAAGARTLLPRLERQTDSPGGLGDRRDRAQGGGGSIAAQRRAFCAGRSRLR
jgi:PAS domain-containing protein